MLIWLSTLPKPRAAFVRIAQPESVDRKSALPDVVPDKESPLLTP